MIIQFICRGNVFRSFIAETYLRSLAISNMIACSSGTVAGDVKVENGPTYSKILALLRQHGLAGYAKDHYGDDIQQDSLDQSTIVVFMNRRVYDEAIERFRISGTIYIWDVDDIGESGKIAVSAGDKERLLEETYQQIVQYVDNLVRAIGQPACK